MSRVSFLIKYKKQNLFYIFSDIMDNRVFYQHPDLMRSLCVHETVMAIMVNRLNKSKQEQTSMALINDMDGITQTNESGENQEIHSPKVKLEIINSDKNWVFRKIKLNL
jgi:hypothetical protein